VRHSDEKDSEKVAGTFICPRCGASYPHRHDDLGAGIEGIGWALRLLTFGTWRSAADMIPFLEAQVERLEAVLCQMFDAFSGYIEYHGVDHEDPDCPEYDTCECALVGAVNEAFAAALPVVQARTRSKP